MKKVWVEKLETWKMKKENYNQRFKEKPIGVTVMRLC